MQVFNLAHKAIKSNTATKFFNAFYMELTYIINNDILDESAVDCISELMDKQLDNCPFVGGLRSIQHCTTLVFIVQENVTYFLEAINNEDEYAYEDMYAYAHVINALMNACAKVIA